jgi:phosphate transport system substrate-binding protein
MKTRPSYAIIWAFMKHTPYHSTLVIFVACLFLTLLVGCQGLTSRTGPGSATMASDRSAYIQNKGSDTVVNLALAWAERYQDMHPDVSISVTGGGSGTGIASLINGTVDIANASRAIKSEEINEARLRGIDPVEHIIARDAIAVIVHPDNPVEFLTMEQVSLIFRGQINNWTELGGENRPIVRISRETNSGTHVYFLEEVIRLGDLDNHEIFSADTLLLPSSEGIIAEVADNPNAIGYDGLGYVTPYVKVVGISETDGGEYIMPSIETVNNGLYPIARDLYMYTSGTLSESVQAYLDWILSPEAQEIVVELGFVPAASPSTSTGSVLWKPTNSDAKSP